ncbi:MAG: hypothetical protein FJ134_10780 [Deltaproteobacteria bacterium]|nr:hypothetical protein [Deltaproteobacteria bacterium]
MKRKARAIILVVILSLISAGAAFGQMGYTMRSAEKGFPTPPPKKPSSAVMFLDAAVGRPLGLATTIVGTTLFVVTLPFTAPSGSAGEAAHGLVVQPAGWTFVRPLGRSDPRFEDKGVFQPPSTPPY